MKNTSIKVTIVHPDPDPKPRKTSARIISNGKKSTAEKTTATVVVQK